jgi:hypothetical protein
VQRLADKSPLASALHKPGAVFLHTAAKLLNEESFEQIDHEFKDDIENHGAG